MSIPDDTGRAPGDEAPPEASESAENVCPDCGGTGLKSGETCTTCDGRGTIFEGVGGG